MKIYEEHEVTETRQKVTAVKCDRCGAEIPKGGLYVERDFELSFKKGTSYPSGGYMDGWEVEDLCDDCVAWLKHLLEEAGVTVSPVEVDW